MAQRPKTPSTPAKRSKNTGGRDAAAAPAKTKSRRNSGAAEPPSGSGVQEQTYESPPGLAEPQPAAEAGAGREDRASRALAAVKTLSEMIVEGIGTLAELRAEMREMNGRLDQLAANRPNAGQAESDGMHQPAAADNADDYQVGRDRDPGDAVPPGVAVMSPTPLTETDEAALHSLEELPKRAGRRGPRAKN